MLLSIIKNLQQREANQHILFHKITAKQTKQTLKPAASHHKHLSITFCIQKLELGLFLACKQYPNVVEFWHVTDGHDEMMKQTALNQM